MLGLTHTRWWKRVRFIHLTLGGVYVWTQCGNGPGVHLLGMHRFSAVDVSERYTWLQVRRNESLRSESILM